MTRRDARWLRRTLLAGFGLAVAVACSTKDYKFVPDAKPDHCRNKFADTELGETAADCGGPDCPNCGPGKACVDTSDCQEGSCLEGFCQAAGCDNGVTDGAETAIDCGGGSCKPCQTGEGCVEARDCDSQACTDGACVAPSCDDGIINGDETGRDCGGPLCGGCGTGSPCNDANDCKSGVCSAEAPRKCEISCSEGTAECDADPAVECETNVLTDAMHCGDCDTACELAHAEQSCVSGRCQIGSCTAPYDNCDNRGDNGCETNLRNTATNCGSCGNECSDDHGTASCVSSKCQIACDDGFENCDDDLGNGCEASVSTDVEACGACTRICPFGEGETPFCRDGVCGATVCPAGTGNCDGVGGDCEQDLTSAVDNCGRCGGVCTVRNGTPRCDGACAVDTCEDGWDNCDTSAADGGYANGCETHVDVGERDTTDAKIVHNCGACGNDCVVSHGSASCVNGECRVMGCDAGYGNCDSSASDGGYSTGCEINTNGDDTNCGVCGRDCDTLLASSNATGKCVSGLCQRDACLPNFGDCDTNSMTCESDFRTDEGDCGDCNTACVPTGTTSQGNECLGATCTPHCDANHANCDTQGPNGCEVDIRTDNANCGGCNMPCATGRTCVGGTCMCTGGLLLCGPNCVDATSNNTHCGMCNNTCTGGRTCVSSVCQCPQGQTFCNGLCVNLLTDNGNCGVCARACQSPTGTTSNTCMGGVCQPVCGTLRDSCDNEPWDGCEENLASNNASCGVCGRACQFGAAAHVNPANMQAGNTCNASGACVPTCASGFMNCDNEPWDGCEADITGGTFCGACGVTCPGGTSCVLSGSTRACQSIITVNSDVEAGIDGNVLSLSHTLSGTPAANRILLLAVVSGSTMSQGINAARPDSVTYDYGGTAIPMTLALEVSGDGLPTDPDPYRQAHFFFYYLTDTGTNHLPTSTGPRTIRIDGATSPSPVLIAANAIQFSGVKQTSPLVTTYTPFITRTGNTDPSSSITPALTGTVLYSLAAAYYTGAASGPMASITATMTGIALQDGMRPFGGYRGAPTQLTGGTAVTMGWDYEFSQKAYQVVVGILPFTP